MKMQLMNETLRFDVLNNETNSNNIKKKNLLKQNYLFHGNLQFQKFIKTSPFVLPGCGIRAKLICIMHTNQPISPATTQWLGKHHAVQTTH